MIDLADPNTDIEQLFKEFMKYYSFTTVSHYTFCMHDIAKWIRVHEFYNGSNIDEEQSMQNAKQIIYVWDKGGLIKMNYASYEEAK